MARPQKEGLDYFPHDTDASSDPKIEPLIILYGSKGYGFYFMHLEYIYRNPELELDISDAEIRQIFCNKLGINQDEYQQILNTAIKHGCFDKELFTKTGRLSSHGIKKRADVVVKKRLEMRARYEDKIKKLAGISEAETREEKAAEMPQSKVKKSKVKKSNNIYSSDSQPYLLAEKLKALILQNNQNAKVPDNLQKWSREIDLMLRIDKRTPEHVQQVIEFSQKDSFWKSNILSAGSLRKQFDKLWLQKDRVQQGKVLPKPDNRTNFKQRKPPDDFKYDNE
jgi:hypothetical protein